MSKLSNDPTHYFRAGIAIKNDSKVILDERLKGLGLKTVGDLVNVVIHSDDAVVEALLPFAKTYLERRADRPAVGKTALLKQLRALGADELRALLDKRDELPGTPGVQDGNL